MLNLVSLKMQFMLILCFFACLDDMVLFHFNIIQWCIVGIVKTELYHVSGAKKSLFILLMECSISAAYII